MDKEREEIIKEKEIMSKENECLRAQVDKLSSDQKSLTITMESIERERTRDSNEIDHLKKIICVKNQDITAKDKEIIDLKSKHPGFQNDYIVLV